MGVVARAWNLLGPNLRARLARLRAFAWLVLAIVAFPLGWWFSVAFVTFASLYANIESGWATGEAADDRALIERLDRIEQAQRREAQRNIRLELLLRQLLASATEQVPDQGQQDAREQAERGDGDERFSGGLA